VPLSVLIVLGLLGIYLLLRGRAAEQAALGSPPDGDARTLDELARAGSDLSRPHRIEFFLFLPDRQAADAVATELRGEGFKVEVGQGEHEADWLCLATREMLPELAALHRWRQRLTAMAESRSGVYDGWGTEVEEG
jgi:regulator of RNase E activity RraB